MSGCDDVPLTRFDSDGDYQTSSDGGTTFVDNPGQDPRNGYGALPGLSGGDGDTKRCQAANSVITYFKNAVASLQQAKDNEATASDLGAVLVGVLLLLGIITLGWIFAFFGAFIALLYANITAEEWGAAFTDDIWNQLVCIVYTHTEADASYTVDDVKAIITDIETTIDPGTAQSFFLDMFKSLWAGGTQAAARQDLGGELSCSCGGCVAEFWGVGVWIGSGLSTNNGTEVERGDCYITVDSTDRGDGKQSACITLIASDSVHCSFQNATQISGPTEHADVRIACGTDRIYTNLATFGYGSGPFNSMGFVGDPSGAPFRIRFDLTTE